MLQNGARRTAHNEESPAHTGADQAQLVGVVGETGDVLANRARGGNASPSGKLASFIDECVAAIPKEARANYQLWLRIDSAGFSKQVVEAATRHNGTGSLFRWLDCHGIRLDNESIGGMRWDRRRRDRLRTGIPTHRIRGWSVGGAVLRGRSTFAPILLRTHRAQMVPKWKPDPGQPCALYVLLRTLRWLQLSGCSGWDFLMRVALPLDPMAASTS